MAKARQEEYASDQQVENFRRNVKTLIRRYRGSLTQLAGESGIGKDTLVRWKYEGLSGKNKSGARRFAWFFGVEVDSLWDEEMRFIGGPPTAEQILVEKVYDLLGTPAKLIVEGVVDALYRSWVMKP